MIDRDKIIHGIDNAKARGYRLRPGVSGLVRLYGEEGNPWCGCALTLAALGNDLITQDEVLTKCDAFREAGTKLGLDNVEGVDFVYGFDSLCSDPPVPEEIANTEAFKLGFELKNRI